MCHLTPGRPGQRSPFQCAQTCDTLVHVPWLLQCLVSRLFNATPILFKGSILKRLTADAIQVETTMETVEGVPKRRASGSSTLEMYAPGTRAWFPHSSEGWACGSLVGTRNLAGDTLTLTSTLIDSGEVCFLSLLYVSRNSLLLPGCILTGTGLYHNDCQARGIWLLSPSTAGQSTDSGEFITHCFALYQDLTLSKRTALMIWPISRTFMSRPFFLQSNDDTPRKSYTPTLELFSLQ